MWDCTHPSSARPGQMDYVHGVAHRNRWLRCLYARDDLRPDHCGPDGRYWEVKNDSLRSGPDRG
jgi:hypothetical protein